MLFILHNYMILYGVFWIQGQMDYACYANLSESIDQMSRINNGCSSIDIKNYPLVMTTLAIENHHV